VTFWHNWGRVVTKIERNIMQRRIALQTISYHIHPFMDEIYDENCFERPSRIIIY
jgi:hypothetical protein